MSALSHNIDSVPAENPTSFENKVVWFNRIALSLVFFWFGFLKIIQISPAETLVSNLHAVTISQFMEINSFLIFLGILECAIGIFWLIPKLTKWAFSLFTLQMCATFLPLFFLPTATWQQSWVLTLTGQYIVKNVVLIASGLTILNHFNKTK